MVAARLATSDIVPERRFERGARARNTASLMRTRPYIQHRDTEHTEEQRNQSRLKCVLYREDAATFSRVLFRFSLCPLCSLCLCVGCRQSATVGANSLRRHDHTCRDERIDLRIHVSVFAQDLPRVLAEDQRSALYAAWR